MIEDNYKRYFSQNNLLKTCKHILFNAIFNFINNKIKEFYNNNNGKETFRKQLKRINAKQIYELNLNFNRELLHKTIKVAPANFSCFNKLCNSSLQSFNLNLSPLSTTHITPSVSSK